MAQTKDQAPVGRNQRMASMYRQGLTLECIGKEMGITRERVRQILRRAGVAAADGGQSKQVAIKKSIQASMRDAKCMATYGVDREEYERLRAIGAVKAFRMQKTNALMRNIDFKFLLVDWWVVWRDSGKFEQRGRSKNSYVMSRIKDSGCYEVGNVHITTLQENSREAVNSWRGKVKALPCGVFENLPGATKPFLAKVGRKSLGYHATSEAANSARQAYIQETGARSGTSPGKGKGWTYIKKCKARPYQCQIAGLKSAYFATQQEAEAHYAATTARLIAERQAA